MPSYGDTPRRHLRDRRPVAIAQSKLMEDIRGAVFVVLEFRDDQLRHGLLRQSACFGWRLAFARLIRASIAALFLSYSCRRPLIALDAAHVRRAPPCARPQEAVDSSSISATTAALPARARARRRREVAVDSHLRAKSVVAPMTKPVAAPTARPTGPPSMPSRLPMAVPPIVPADRRIGF